MKALVDADTPVFAVALVSEDVDEALAKHRLDKTINDIIIGSGASEAHLFVSGGDNFRKQLCPSYKEHRKDKPVPKYREMLRQHLIWNWGAVECEGYEADDACGIYQSDDTIICGIDKDLLQIPGKHYQWPIVRKGVVVRPELYHNITEEQGMRNFFTQMLTGDVADNIKGIHGVGIKRAEAILAPCSTENEMYGTVRFYYSSSLMTDMPEEEEERFNQNLDLLWIWRQFGETYTIRRQVHEIPTP